MASNFGSQRAGERQGRDWQLSVFRFGLVACIVGVIVAATQFDIAESIEAVWIHAPTTQEVAAESVAYQNKKTVCLDAHAATKPAEYPSSCYANQPNIPELARDVAVTNLVGFVLTTLAVLATMVAMGILGVRMARESGR
jgi:hypothetical protein